MLVLGYCIVAFVLGFIQGLIPQGFFNSLVSLAIAIIEIPLAYGLVISCLKFFNGEDVKLFDFLSAGFSNFARAWKVSLWTLVKMLVPVILLVVAIIMVSIGSVGLAVAMFSSSSNGLAIVGIIGIILYVVAIVWLIIKSYAYQLSILIAIENTDITAKESVERSAELMNGRKGKLFFLQLSFIGWVILAAFTFGIGMLWLAPYILFAVVVFYKDALGNGKAVEVKTEGPIQEN